MSEPHRKDGPFFPTFCVWQARRTLRYTLHFTFTWQWHSSPVRGSPDGRLVNFGRARFFVGRRSSHLTCAPPAAAEPSSLSAAAVAVDGRGEDGDGDGDGRTLAWKFNHFNRPTFTCSVAVTAASCGDKGGGGSGSLAGQPALVACHP